MKAVDSSRWRQLSSLLDEMLELDGEARELRLAHLRLSDAALADELAALLAQQTPIDNECFLDGSALEGASGAAEATLAGLRVGAYTLERPLGAGGMGTVWLAQRSDGRFAGRVAVKLLNLALVGRSGAERFAREGNLLARLAHPHIARLLDAGTTAGGQPYLVLEHIQGQPIDRWCDTHALPVDARVRLMQDVLAAVAHAHARLVLHRDLKPSNILVTPEGQVKLLDFGIAKLLADEAAPAQATELTQLAGRAFTPDYAAPEQVQGGDVGTATDVYALGVLLYVLLGGTHPTARSADTPVERLRSVVEAEPPRLSDAARTDPDAATRRSESPLKLSQALRGDLDNIVAKALKKLPAERYPTAAAFADDLRRYLDNEPVLARRDSLGYRATKFVRRHRLAVGAAVALFVMLVAGVVGTTWQAIEARRERDDALFQAERALAKSNLFNLMLGALGTAKRTLTQRELLDRSVQLVSRQFGKDPRIAIDLLLPIAGQYQSLGDSLGEFAVMQRAAAFAQASGEPQLLAQVACNTVDTELRLGHPDQAMAQLRAGQAALARLPRPGFALIASCLHAEADVAEGQGDLGRAAERIGAAIALAERSNQIRGIVYRSLLSRQTQLHRARGNLAASMAGLKKEQRLHEDNGQTDSFHYVGARRNEAAILFAWGEVLQASQIVDSLVPSWRGLSEDGAAPPWFDSTRGMLMLRIGDAQGAHALLATVAERVRAQGSVQAMVSADFALAQALLALGRLDDAERSLQAVESAPASRASGLNWHLTPATLRAEILLARGQPAQAAPLIDAELVRLGWPGAPPTLVLATALRVAAQVRLALADAQRAQTFAAAAVTASEGIARNAAASADVGEALLALAHAQRLAGNADQARATAQRAVPVLTAGLGDAHRLTRQARALAGG